MPSVLSRFWSATHPFWVTGCVMSLGDLVSQKVIEKKPDFDVPRNLRFAGLGLLFVAPVLHHWFKFLDKIIVGQRGIQPLKKVIVDQSLMAPSINTSILVILATLEGKKWPEIKGKLQNNLPAILINQYKLWPIVQCVNFYLVPLEYRVLVVVFVAFFWNIYLANALQAEKPIEATE